MKEVKIGNQTWMAENLNVNDGGEGIYVNPKNGETYYTWEAAKRVAKSIEGWHLPSKEEWKTFTKNINENLFKKSFNALLVGVRYCDGSFGDMGFDTYFWSNTGYDSNYAYNICFNCKFVSAHIDIYSKNFGFSIRLVKD